MYQGNTLQQHNFTQLGIGFLNFQKQQGKMTLKHKHRSEKIK